MGSETNMSPAAREKRIRELAALDWKNLPTSQIRQYFEDTYGLVDLTYQTLSQYRATPEYQETWQQLKDVWDKEMMRLPHTNDLKKKISQGMTLSLNVLIEILAGKAQHKDKISAARLMAQLDGRFLKIGEEDPAGSRASESLANELLTAIQKQTVQ